ncbi:cysteine synthase [Magnetococcus marinus MC-1]|uniref:Cysteine synthase n=1 Tax=Magnetococcus marinus (strain ATCC BAA-1437 / JCM 17883 / MC-1) TaxID=156889 RepID=A0L9G0_MAGMM|nr:cysteine synthase CysM [Magnetococcus marinus]ABK44603.1 cysteine synthase [Magnetococcus marinus MC-1]
MATLESLIGNTPLVDLDRVVKGCVEGVKLLAKVEGNNPGGSVKDRAAYGMFMGAEQRGVLNRETRIFEATSGNTGIALAMMAARRGYQLTLVMPETMTLERRATMAAYGADFLLVTAEQGMEGAIDLVNAKVANGEGIKLDQFSNADNWGAHYRTTGPEIWRDTQGQITHFVSAMGTTGTIMGVSRALKERNPQIQIIGVQPDEGSQIAGIRRWPQAYMPKIFEPSRVDTILDVNTAEAREMTRRLARDEGLFCGLSAGGAVAAALKVCQGLSQPGTVVVIIPDRGDRYLSTDLFL